MNPRPPASASLGNLLQMQIIRPQPRPNESQILRVGQETDGLTSPLGYSEAL